MGEDHGNHKQTKNSLETGGGPGSRTPRRQIWSPGREPPPPISLLPPPIPRNIGGGFQTVSFRNTRGDGILGLPDTSYG